MKEILGDFQDFFAMQRNRLASINIDVSTFTVSHLAFRTHTYSEYLDVRDRIEQYCTANLENVWNGRPISKLLLASPLDLGDGFETSLIELIPPVHQRVYKMGLEHIGFVVGEDVEEFSIRHRAALTGQQFQSLECEPYYVLFEDYTHVKFYRESLMEVCKKEGQIFEGFTHVDDWEA